jgi:multidrug resistance efflux pump
MLEIIILLYALAVWWVFFKRKLYPWNKRAKIIVFVTPVVFVLIMILLMNIFAPSSSDVRVTRHEVPIIPQVKGRVIEVGVTDNQRVKKGDVLFKIDPEPYQASANALNAKLKLAKKRLEENRALVKTGSGNRFDLEKAEADYEELKEKTDNSYWELEQTIVRAPNNGTVVNAQLRPGVFLVPTPLRAAMSFLEDEPQVFMLFHQNELHQIKPGHEAEFYVPTNPGQVYKAKVESVIWAQRQGQVNASGDLPQTGVRPAVPNRFPVKLILEEGSHTELIAAGAIGHGAIYTDNMSFLHFVRKVMLRVYSKLNYIVPKLH